MLFCLARLAGHLPDLQRCAACHCCSVSFKRTESQEEQTWLCHCCCAPPRADLSAACSGARIASHALQRDEHRNGRRDEGMLHRATPLSGELPRPTRAAATRGGGCRRHRRPPRSAHCRGGPRPPRRPAPSAAGCAPPSPAGRWCPALASEMEYWCPASASGTECWCPIWASRMECWYPVSASRTECCSCFDRMTGRK